MLNINENLYFDELWQEKKSYFNYFHRLYMNMITIQSLGELMTLKILAVRAQITPTISRSPSPPLFFNNWMKTWKMFPASKKQWDTGAMRICYSGLTFSAGDDWYWYSLFIFYEIESLFYYDLWFLFTNPEATVMMFLCCDLWFHVTLFYLNKNDVFHDQAGYSYFSADFMLKIFL